MPRASDSPANMNTRFVAKVAHERDVVLDDADRDAGRGNVAHHPLIAVVRMSFDARHRLVEQEALASFISARATPTSF